MKLMVIGGGGREHAIIKKLKENPAVEEIYCLPGNGGIAADAVCVPEIGAKDIPAQVDDMLSAYTGEGYNGNSFLSPQNENTRSVQFVLTTRAIEPPADTEPAADEAAIPDEFRQFVNRLIDLFRQYK
mgnify:CR=1 FL=1